MMTGSEFTAEYAEAFGKTKTAAKKEIEWMLDNAIKFTDKFDGLIFKRHRFKKTVNKSRNARNPRTGEKITTKEKAFVIFKTQVE